MRGLLAISLCLLGLTIYLGFFVPPTAGMATVVNSPRPASSARTEPAPARLDMAQVNADLGAVFGVSWGGPGLPQSLRSLVIDEQVGTVALFTANFQNASGLRRLDDQLAQLGGQACLDAPLLVSTDAEGGEASQLHDAYTPTDQYDLGLRGASAVEQSERRNSAHLNSLGVGMLLAPVADLRTNPRDQVIGDRSFGSDPKRVVPLITAATKGIEEGGAAATVKHFPGLGGAPGNPHSAIATDPVGLAQWQKTQELSFQAAIAAGAEAVMTTAVYVPGLTSDGLPAMLSPQAISLLRDQMGFEGVIVTDSLSMGAVQARFPLWVSAPTALEAGNDLILLGNDDPGLERKAIDATRQAVVEGKISPAQLHASAERVRALRRRHGLPGSSCRRPRPGESA